jgi:hypothetical protein
VRVQLKSSVFRSSRRQAFAQGTESREISMTRNALVHIGSYAVIIAGLLVPAVSYAANSPYDQSGTNPAQSNCDSKTGCANYATGDQTKINPSQPKHLKKKAKTTKAHASQPKHLTKKAKTTKAQASQPQQQKKS